MVLGETQILGQMKKAFAAAQEQQTATGESEQAEEKGKSEEIDLVGPSRPASPRAKVSKPAPDGLVVYQDGKIIFRQGVAPRRGPAAEAIKLYEETPASREAREQYALERRLANETVREGGRPTKRDRRELERLKGKKP